jgi:ribonucleoside-diphosphate reductase alpha chain
MDSFATTVSVALQYGVPLRDLVNKFAHVRFEPAGFTGNQEIPIAKSIVDYIFRWLGSRFLGPDDKASLGLIDRSAIVTDAPAPFGAPISPAPSGSAEAISGAAAASSSPAQPAPAATDKPIEPKASVAVDAAPAPRADTVASDSIKGGTPAGTSSPAGEPLAVVASNGHANGHAAAGNGNGSPGKSTVTLSLGATNVAFKIQEDAPSCAECGSIMIRNGSCYKCLNCGSTSGCS